MIAQFYFSFLQSSGTVFITMVTSLRLLIEPAEMIPLHKHKNKANWALSNLKYLQRFLLKFIFSEASKQEF